MCFPAQLTSYLLPGLRSLITRLALSSSLAVLTSSVAAQETHRDGELYRRDSCKVRLSPPQLVQRSPRFLWFPSMHHRGNDRLVALLSTYADQAQENTSGVIIFSDDGGVSWSKPLAGPYCEMVIDQPDGSLLLLPYYLRFESEGRATGSAQRIAKEAKTFQRIKEPVVVTGWPRNIGLLDADLGKPKAEWKLASFVFNGQSVRSSDSKSHLATLYGRFAGTKCFSLVLAESTDGLKWNIRSIIADETCKLPGKEGPCESALVRLKDGRLLCVFRLDSEVPYGHSFSQNDGKSWSKPQSLDGLLSVQPSLAVSAEGKILLTGGRPGLFLWLNRKGDALRWDKIDLQAHHNKYIKKEPILKAAAFFESDTSCYTEVRWLDDKRFVVLYDRLANGWKAIPADSKATNSVWIVHGRME
ncbi:MAG: sialidase family protein [Gemmataceae bacterium]